jgi:hypothetical protein
MNTLSTRPFLAMLLALGLAAPARSAQSVDETRPASADASISIENLSGSITITGWDREELKVTGTLGEGTEGLEISGGPERLRVEVVIPRRSRHVSESYLEVSVPKEARLSVSTVNADVSCAAFAGRLGANTVNGEVNVKDKLAEIDVETVSGDIALTVDCPDLEASSVSGEIRIEGARGDTAVETVSGDVRIAAGVLERFQCGTVSGDLEFSGALSPKGRYSFGSQSGNIRLTLSAKPDAEFEISTFSGDIDNDFGPEATRTSKYVPAQELSFTEGDGGASVEIETFSGDVELLAP